MIPEWRGWAGTELLAGRHFLWLIGCGPLGSWGKTLGEVVVIFLVLEPNLEGVSSPASLQVQMVEQMPWASQLWEFVAVFSYTWGVLGTQQLWGHSSPLPGVSFSILAQSLLSMTRTRCLWSSWTALQNVSGGASAHMAHCWRMTASMQWSLLFCISWKSWVSWGSLGPSYSFLIQTHYAGCSKPGTSALPGEQPVGGKPQPAGGPDIGPECLELHLPATWGRGLNSCCHSWSQLSFCR